MKKWLKRLKKDERGLTLVELLAVVVILAIVAAIAFISIGNVIENSKKDAHVANALQIISAAKLAEASGDEQFSSTTVDVLHEDTGLNTLGSVIDPWDKNSYTSANITKDGEGEFIITLKPDGECVLTSVPESVLQEGRKEACGYTAP